MDPITSKHWISRWLRVLGSLMGPTSITPPTYRHGTPARRSKPGAGAWRYVNPTQPYGAELRRKNRLHAKWTDSEKAIRKINADFSAGLHALGRTPKQMLSLRSRNRMIQRATAKMERVSAKHLGV